MLTKVGQIFTRQTLKDTAFFASLFVGGEIAANKQREYYKNRENIDCVFPSIGDIEKCKPLLENHKINPIFNYKTIKQQQQTFSKHQSPNKINKKPLFQYSIQASFNYDVIKRKSSFYKTVENKTHENHDDNHNGSHALATTLGWAIPSGVVISKWYSFLDNDLKKTSLGKWASKFGKTRLIWLKITLDLLADAPLYGSYIAAQRQFGGADISKPFFEVFTTMYLTDLVFWIPVNTINFFKVPATYRVPFYSTAVFCWSIILPMITKE